MSKLDVVDCLSEGARLVRLHLQSLLEQTLLEDASHNVGAVRLEDFTLAIQDAAGEVSNGQPGHVGRAERKNATVLIEAAISELALENARQLRSAICLTVLNDTTESVNEMIDFKEGNDMRACSLGGFDDSRLSRSFALIDDRLARGGDFCLIACQFEVLNLLDVLSRLDKDEHVHEDILSLVRRNIPNAIVAATVEVVDLDLSKVLRELVSLVSQISTASVIADRLEDGTTELIAAIKHGVGASRLVVGVTRDVDLAKKHIPA